MKFLSIVTLCLFSLACDTSQDSNSIIVSGKITGQDGHPMPMARILPPESKAIDIDSTGLFSFELPKPGSAHLWFLGVGHKSIYFPIYVDSLEDLQLDIVLESGIDLPSPESLFVVGSFNNFSPTEGLLPMILDEDGVFSKTIESPADTFAFQLIGLGSSGEISMASIQADYFSSHGRYVYSGSPGSFTSVLESPNDSVLIEYRPEYYVERVLEPLVNFSDPESRSAKMYAYKNDLYELNAEVREATAKYFEEATGEDFAFDHSKTQAALKEMLAEETDSLLKNYLQLDYFSNINPHVEDSMMVTELLTNLSHTSSLWETRSFENILHRLSYSTNDKEAIDKYRESMLEEHPHDRVRSSLLGSKVRIAFDAMEVERKKFDIDQEVENRAGIEFSELYDRLITEFPESHDAKRATKRFDENRTIQAGKKVPEFSIASIEDDNLQLGTEYFQDKIWLIDFWALSCGPCLGEMKYMHEAFDRFESQGLNILSLSFDDRVVIQDLRQKRWPMPWYHGSMEDGFYSGIAKKFDLVAIPRKVLVDREGTILALDGDLRGEKLMATLQVFFQESSTTN